MKKQININNTDTGPNSVTINKNNGVARFTNILSPGQVDIFTINSDKITSNTAIAAIIKYDFAASGTPVICAQATGNGSASIKIANFDQSNPTASELVIYWWVTTKFTL